MGSFEATTIHVAKTNECIIDDWQSFSNIEEENELAAIAVLGYMHEWKECQGEKHFLHDAAFGKHMPQE